MSMNIEFVVAVGKKEQARYHAIVGGTAMTGYGPGPAPGTPDVVFTMTPADADALRDGTLDLAVGFMRGQIKMAGDFGAVLQLLPLTSGRDASVAVESVLAEA